MSTLEDIRHRSESDARSRGYYLNPDPELLQGFIEGLKHNQDRYGYPLCPCRLASGNFELDGDITCPCDYRDPDVEEYGACYCGLYLRRDVFEGQTPLSVVPERRPFEKQTEAYGVENLSSQTSVIKETGSSQLKLWYCKQCGYVCFRKSPPYICPICKAKQTMFTEVMPAVRT